MPCSAASPASNGKANDEDEIRTYGHIVIDEVQDLSPMQLRMASRRSLNGSMTVVGDIAQATGTHAPRDWDDVLAHLPDRRPARLTELTVGYRIPAQVMALATRVLRSPRPALQPPTSVREGDAPARDPSAPTPTGSAQAIADAVDPCSRPGRRGQRGRRGARRRSLADGRGRAAPRPACAFGQAARTGLDAGVNVVPVRLVKGLELDGVVVVEPARIVQRGDRKGCGRCTSPSPERPSSWPSSTPSRCPRRCSTTPSSADRREHAAHPPRRHGSGIITRSASGRRPRSGRALRQLPQPGGTGRRYCKYCGSALAAVAVASDGAACSSSAGLVTVLVVASHQVYRGARAGPGAAGGGQPRRWHHHDAGDGDGVLDGAGVHAAAHAGAPDHAGADRGRRSRSSRPARSRRRVRPPPYTNACGEAYPFDASYLQDGDFSTAWRVKGEAVGRQIRLRLAAPTLITEVGMVPGWAKIDGCDGGDLFRQHRTVAKVRWIFDGGQVVEQELSPERTLQVLPVSVTTRNVIVQILATNQPNGIDMTAISEVTAGWYTHRLTVSSGTVKVRLGTPVLFG